jgi:hypothetical protein
MGALGMNAKTHAMTATKRAWTLSATACMTEGAGKQALDKTIDKPKIRLPSKG